MNRSILPALALLLAAPAFAQRTEAGVQAAIIFPQNDLRDNANGALGLTFGVSVSYPLGSGNDLRGRLDYVQCDTTSFHMLVLSTTRQSAHGVGLGADLLHYVETGSRGLYGLVGTGLHWWSASNPAYGDTNETAPYFHAGAGFRFNRAVAAEITYELGRFRSTAGTAGSIQTGVVFRF